MFAQCVDDCCTCTKKLDRSPTNCQYAKGPFTKRSANGVFVGRTFTVRYSTQFERFWHQQCDNGSLAQRWCMYSYTTKLWSFEFKSELFIVTPILGVCNCSMFCCALLYVNFSFAIIMMGKRELVALLGLSSWCLVMVVWLCLAVPVCDCGISWSYSLFMTHLKKCS